MLQVFQAGLFHESKKTRIVDVPLRVQISITDLNRDFKIEDWHAPIIQQAIIQQALARIGFLIYTYILGLFVGFLSKEEY
jgi:hypothetical protein